MIHLYSALLCIVVHPKRFTIVWVEGGSLLNHHQCAAFTWMIRRLPQDNSTSALTTNQLQVERERVIESIKCMLSPHTSYRWRGERVIETIKCMRSPHTSYRWRGERRVIESIKCMLSPTHQLQVERRESHRGQSSVCAHHTPANRWRGERES